MNWRHQAPDAPVPGHPLARMGLVVRAWMLSVVILLMFNAFVANEIVLSPLLRPVPFVVLAVFSLVWFLFAWSARVTVVCATTVSVGVWLRSVEVAFFATDYDLRARSTGASIWLFVSVTVLVLGFLNLLAISRVISDSKFRREAPR